VAERRDWQRIGVITRLGTAQTLAWASSYYLPAILADPIARDLGVSAAHVFAAFSAALLLTALVGPRVGQTIDRFGGREVLAASSLLFASGLALLATAESEPVLWVAWLILGVGMGLGLYDAAFATAGRFYGETARGVITGITLIAGFASTVGWPLTAWGEATLGWRWTCAAWAFAHLVLGLPLNLWLPKLRQHAIAIVAPAKPRIAMDRTMWLLCFAFAAGMIVAAAMAAHLPRLLEAAGATSAAAIAAGALIGPTQVAARIGEAAFLSRFHPLLSARLSTMAHPLGAGLLLAGGGWLAMPFTVLHGAGNGIFTIVRGTVPLAIYGRENYGYRLGLLGAPGRILQAGTPLAFGVLIEAIGSYALIVSAPISLAASIARFGVGQRLPKKL
jgi:nitrate/nitrite transporter NarK